jgi:hypothetical protein
MSASIPNQAVFVWDDSFFPYGAYLSMRSAARRGGFDAIYLLKTPQLDGVAGFERLRQEVPQLRPVNIDLPGWLEEARVDCIDELLAANAFLKERKYHGSVSDMLRSLWLLLNGGVYMDTDTLSLRPFGPLLDQQGFLAQEHILVSSKVWRRNSRWRYFKTAPLTLFRDLCARASFGIRWFRRFESFYVLAIHNAVMGFRKGHPMMRDVLSQIAQRYPRRPQRYPLLGPDTLQDLEEQNSYEGVRVYPPAYFSPLGPTMTFQYFHPRRPKVVDALRQQAILPETVALHWSGNATTGKITPQNDDDVRRLAGTQLFSRLALEAALGEGAS